MLLHEQLLLLDLDDEKGTSRSSYAHIGLAGALILDLVPRLAGRLIEVGVLAADEHKTLGLFSSTRLPEQDHAPELEVVGRLRGVLVGDAQPDQDTAILAGLAASLGLIGTVVGKDQRKDQRKDSERRAKELGKGDEFGDAVAQAIQATQEAVLVAVVAATAATSAAST